MVLWKHYYLAENIQGALELLSHSNRPARLIAGGTDLLIDLQQGRHPPVDTLVDITNIPELTLIDIIENKLFIGAAVPLTRILQSSMVIENAQALVEACQLIGGPQVRNTATLGGNVAHALPAADGTIALLALDAKAVTADKSGRYEIPIADLFVGPGQSALHPRNDILIGFYINILKSRQASRFSRVMRPQGVALPILNTAVWLEREADSIHDIRIALGPSGPTPRRAAAAEKMLQGHTLTDTMIEQAYKELVKQLSFRTSPLRASAEYRVHLSSVLFRNSIKTAFSRAGKNI